MSVHSYLMQGHHPLGHQIYADDSFVLRDTSQNEAHVPHGEFYCILIINQINRGQFAICACIKEHSSHCKTINLCLWPEPLGETFRLGFIMYSMVPSVGRKRPC